MSEKLTRFSKMRNPEKRLLDFIQEHIHIVFLVLISAVAIGARYAGWEFVSRDATRFLLPWHEAISIRGWSALSEQIGNYGMPYQLLILTGTYLPISPLSWYKLTSTGFDFLLSIQIYILTQRLTSNKTTAAIAYSVSMILLPTTILNSSVWAQCDSIYTCFIIASLNCLLVKRTRLSFFFLGIALSFKLQACFILPFYIYWYFTQRSYSLSMFLWTLLGFYLLSIPGIICGRSILDPLKIYFAQTTISDAMYFNYPSFWVFVGNDPSTLKATAIFFTIALLLAGYYITLSQHSPHGSQEPHLFLIQIATWSAWTCIEFLPTMHERYGYLVTILLFVCYLSEKNRKTQINTLFCCIIR